MTYKVGDTVRMKSGGPLMTVEIVLRPSGSLSFAWFDGAEKKTGVFPPEVLVSDNGAPPAWAGQDRTDEDYNPFRQ